MREIEENKWMEERPDENKDVLAVFSRGATHIYLKKVMASSLKKKKTFSKSLLRQVRASGQS